MESQKKCPMTTKYVFIWLFLQIKVEYLYVKKLALFFLFYIVVSKLVWIQKKKRLFNKLLKSKKHMIQLFSSWQFFSIARRLWSQSSKISGKLSLLLLWLLQWPKCKQFFFENWIWTILKVYFWEKWNFRLSNLL